jgi:hypothetical protein
MSSMFWSGGYIDFKDVDVKRVKTNNKIAISLEKTFGLYVGQYKCHNGSERISLFWPGKEQCYFRESVKNHEGDVTSVLLCVDHAITHSCGSDEFELAIEALLSSDRLSERTIVDINEKNIIELPRFSTESELVMKLDLLIIPPQDEKRA